MSIERTESLERLLRSNIYHGRINESGIQLSEQLAAFEQDDSVWYCFGDSEREQHPRNFIPFFHVLWANSTNHDNVIEVVYVEKRKKTVEIRRLHVEVAGIRGDENISEYVVNQAYQDCTIAPSVLVIVNPHGGQGKAGEFLREQIMPVLTAAQARVDIVETERAQHGVELGRTLNAEKYDVVACCSGDGIPHEVINGAYQREDKGRGFFEHVAVTQLPCGSGNALSLSTHGTNDAATATFMMLKAQRTRMDVMAVTQKGRGTRLSFLSQTYGAIADSDIGTEHLRWMGPVRFELGVAGKMMTKASYPCDLWVKYEARGAEVREHFDRIQDGGGAVDTGTKISFETCGPSLDVPVPKDWVQVPERITQHMNIFYVGNLPYMLSDAQFFPAALPNDGFMDLVLTDTSTPFLEFVRLLTSIDSGAHVHSSHVHHAKISAYRLVPRVSLEGHYISVDGENFPFEPLQVEVLPRALTVLMQKGLFVDTCFTRPGAGVPDMMV